MPQPTEDISLPSLAPVIESLKGVSEQFRQAADQIGAAIAPIQKLLTILPFRFSPVAQDMMDAWEGNRKAARRLAKTLLFQLPPDLMPTLRRKAKKSEVSIEYAQRELIVRCILQIMACSEDMPIRKFDDGRTGPSISLGTLTPREAYDWLIAEVYYAAPYVVHEIEYLPQVRVNRLPSPDESGIWVHDLDFWRPSEGQQLTLPAPRPYTRPGPKGPPIPPGFKQTCIETYRMYCLLNGYDDGRVPPQKDVAAYHGLDPRTYKKWREHPTINLPYPPE